MKQTKPIVKILDKKARDVIKILASTHGIDASVYARKITLGTSLYIFEIKVEKQKTSFSSNEILEAVAKVLGVDFYTKIQLKTIVIHPDNTSYFVVDYDNEVSK